MPIKSVTSNAEDLTLTIVGEYPVPVERLWEAYADPRQLEKFWGPETWPATFTRHDLVAGGRSSYYMTGPNGEKARGWWRFLAVEPNRRIELEDGFANEDGEPNETMPTMRMVFTFEPTPEGSRFTSVTTFPSVEAMEQMVKMGMDEGLRSALGQLDGVLTDHESFAADRGTRLQILSDTQVRVTRVIRAPVEQVWRAHQDPELMKRWMLGPEGWVLPVCEITTEVGQRYRYEWEKADGTERFGFEGELLELTPLHRAVTTERMIGTEGPETLNELTFTPVRDGTLLSIVITYPNSEVRDTILATGMVNGMEMSYAQLESEVLAPAAV